jgi:eukaryotic-like serine/threonine-protein kinase
MKPGYLLRNRYRIEKNLATGGFGETYLAIDLDYPGQRQVVVKHLKPAAQDPGTLRIAARLFESEAKALAEMGETSNRVPMLYAYFEEQGQFYLVQEFIDGLTLTAELGNVARSESETLGILKEILAGLKVVHSKNKIHRDLKPDNIIRRAKDRRLVLIDFGAVKDIRQANLSNPNLALSASIGIGTRGYMPTEQAIGFPRLASDIYAVGAIGIQCLTGRQPGGLFDEEMLALRWQHLCQVSPGLAEILEKMVAQKAVDRYGDAMEAERAIGAITQKQSVESEKPQEHQSPAPVEKPLSMKTTIITPPVEVETVIDQPPVVTSNFNRRKILELMGFAGGGVFLSYILSELSHNNSTPSISEGSKSPGVNKSSKSAPDDQNSSGSDLKNFRKFTFTSVRLNNAGEVMDRPSGVSEGFIDDLGNGVDLRMVKIPAGKFEMGSPNSEKKRGANEGPQHLVTLPEFYMGQTLITQAQWQAIMGSNPSKFKGDGKPVDSVNWLDAMDFCSKLSKKAGRIYRLPSEAEWEYACRAGTTTPFAFGETISPTVVNYNGNYPYAGAKKGENRLKTTVVGSFPSNLFGLYDMHGNLWEWCLDEYIDNYKITPADGSARGDINSRSGDKRRLLRGGSWDNQAEHCRAADRDHDVASLRGHNCGLRVVSRNS